MQIIFDFYAFFLKKRVVCRVKMRESACACEKMHVNVSKTPYHQKCDYRLSLRGNPPEMRTAIESPGCAIIK